MFSEDDRRNAGNGEKLGFEVAGLQHGDERFGVALESGWIGGDVRNAEQRGEALENLRLMLETVLVRVFRRILSCQARG